VDRETAALIFDRGGILLATLQVREAWRTDEAVKEKDNFCGRRVPDKTRGGQILVSRLVRNLVGSLARIVFLDAGRKQLKGIGRRWVYEVVWERA